MKSPGQLLYEKYARAHEDVMNRQPVSWEDLEGKDMAIWELLATQLSAA